MLTIKLSKVGKTNKKMFRVVILEKSRDPYGDVLEILGSYNPHSQELVVKAERIKYWLSRGAQMTATINNLLVEKKIIEGKKATASKANKPSKKRLAQIKAKADKKATREAKPAEAASETKEPTEIPIEISGATVDNSVAAEKSETIKKTP